MSTVRVLRYMNFGFLSAVLLSGYCYSDDVKKEGHELSKKHWWQFSETSGLDLEASGKEKKGTLSVGFSLGGWYVNPSFTGSIDDDSYGQYINRDGLIVGSEVSFSASRFLFNESAMAAKKNTTLKNGSTVEEHEFKVKASDVLLRACKKEAERLQEDAVRKCKEEQEYFYKISKPVDLAVNPLEKFSFITFAMKKTNTKFSYLDLETLEKNKQDEDGYAVELSGGRVNTLKASRWELGLSYQEGYSFAGSNKERNVCSPISDTAFTECAVYRTAPPLKTARIVPFAAVSKQFPSDRVLKGIQFKLSYLDDKKELVGGSTKSDSKWLVEAPIYFFSNTQNAFSGGLKLAWVSEVSDDEDKFSASIFFSKPLDVFK